MSAAASVTRASFRRAGVRQGAWTLRDRHRAAFTGSAVLIIAGSWWAGDASPAIQLGALALAAAAGLPHGALDHLAAARLLRPGFGRFWPLLFLFSYLGLAAAVLLAWAITPVTTLALFLGLSAYHFGLHDGEGAGRLRLPSIVAHGGVPIIVPALFHPADLEMLFAWLTAGDGKSLLGVLRGPMAAVWAAACMLLLVRAIRAREMRAAMAELAVVVVAFALLPPLIAFALYFGALHSLRALLMEAERGQEGAKAQIAALLRRAAPLSLAALALAAVGFYKLGGLAQPSVALVQTVFFTLSALTAPHMALTALSTRAETLRRG